MWEIKFPAHTKQHANITVPNILIFLFFDSKLEHKILHRTTAEVGERWAELRDQGRA